MRKKDVLTERLEATLELPEGFYEAVFAGFSVVRSEGAPRCVRYAVGEEEQGCFLPFYDHRPGVVEAAADCERDMTPESALQLMASLRGPAAVEVRARAAGGKKFPFVTLWAAGPGEPVVRLAGRREVYGPGEVAAGTSFTGTDARWHWTGVIPDPKGGGLAFVYVGLEGAPPEPPRRPPPRRDRPRPYR
ncbi:MAG: hypothetical protein ACYDA8_12495 [Deferrisomatales bacterium]